VVVAPDLPAVRGDRPRLREAVRHLLDNALRYQSTGATPRIEVAARRRRGEVEVEVRDNGPGIAPEYQQKVFELFERLDSGASEGTGIGLALVKRIVEVHGGRIWVESEGGGKGSTFRFTVPAA
jgi:signal transduction histidine kinase